MFGCRKKTTNERIVSISADWINRPDHLRQLATADELICPLCQFSLNYRCGAINRPHFSHRPTYEVNDKSCPLSKERRSKEESEAMLLLFQALERKYPSAVEAEVLLPSERQTIDILITKDGKPVHAYWLMSRHRRQSTIEQLLAPATSRGIPYHVVFTRETHRLEGEILHLSPTQAKQIQYTEAFDICEDDGDDDGHLYFLDMNEASILIYRGLFQRRHHTSTYRYWGCREALLDDILLHETGTIITQNDQADYSAKQSLHVAKQKRLLTTLPPSVIDDDISAETTGNDVSEPQIKRQKNTYQPNYEKLICKYCSKAMEKYTIRLADKTCVCHDCLSVHNQQTNQKDFDW